MTDPATPEPQDLHPSATVRWLLIAVGIVATLLGIVGAFLPVLPTTPFLLVAAACFARASPKLDRMLTGSATFGPTILEWRRHRSIPWRTKLVAIGLMSAMIAVSAVLFVRSVVGSGAARGIDGVVDEVGKFLLDARRLVFRHGRRFLVPGIKPQPGIEQVTLLDRFDDRRICAFEVHAPTARLESKTLKLAMEGQIFDEGKGLLPNTLKKGFPSPGTGQHIAALLPPARGRSRTSGRGAGRRAEGAAPRLSALPNRLG